MTDQVTNLASAEAFIKTAQTKRTIYWFNVPARLTAQTGYKRLGFIELLAHEEMMCANRAANASNPEMALGFELAKEAFRRVDEQSLSTGDGTTDVFWGASTPGLSKIRQLVLAAYARIHQPESGDAADFLGSMETKIG